MTRIEIDYHRITPATARDHIERSRARLDRAYLRTQTRIRRLILRLFRRPVNCFAKYVLSVSQERDIINSRQFHEMAAIVDRSLWPERFQDHA